MNRTLIILMIAVILLLQGYGIGIAAGTSCCAKEQCSCSAGVCCLKGKCICPGETCCVDGQCQCAAEAGCKTCKCG